MRGGGGDKRVVMSPSALATIGAAIAPINRQSASRKYARSDFIGPFLLSLDSPYAALVGLSRHINVFILYYFAYNRRDLANSQDILYGMVQNMGEQNSRDYDCVVLLIRRTAGGEINK
jgi:hypothetical protein